MPSIGAHASGAMRSRAPRALSIRTPAGINPSPHALSGGAAARSQTTVASPARAAAIAVARPAGPAPTTATSALSPTAEPRPRERQRGARGFGREADRAHRTRWRQLAGEKPPQRLAPAHLAARGAGKRPRFEQTHGMRPDAGALQNCAPDSLRGAVVASRVAGAFREHEQVLAPVALGDEPEGDRAAGPHARDSGQAFLELLRRVVGPADDDEVLGAGADVQLAARDEPQVAGVEEAVRERARGRAGEAEVPGHHEPPADEDAPDPALG